MEGKQKMPRYIKYIKYVLAICCALLLVRYFGLLLHFFEKDYHNEFHYPYDGEIMGYVHQLRNGEKPSVAPINDYNYSFIKNCSLKCKKHEQPQLVYIVKSAPENFLRRLAIRKSWGDEHRFSNVTIKTVFVIGTRNNIDLMNSIINETTEYKDIVFCDFNDDYYNNTIKTMMGFKWAVNFCPHSKFYMFVDDDYYVSTKNVLSFVRNPTNYPYENTSQFVKENGEQNVILNKREVKNFESSDDIKLYSGFVLISAPHRHRNSKWFVSLEEYPYHLWPPYVTAGSYVLSKEALHVMYYASFYTQHFRFDDIYLGLVALKAHIEPYHNEEFHFYVKKYDILEYTYFISSHGYGDPDELLKVWNEQKSIGNA